jgi:2'-5' RNA ligase
VREKGWRELITPEIQVTYSKLWGQAVQSIETNSVRIDPSLVNKDSDLRRGFTLICRPSHSVQRNVMDFLGEARMVEPNQYYYQSHELHTTVLTIITCHVDFRLNEIDLSPYVEALNQAVANVPMFQIRYHGITASPECVMIQGFPEGQTLELLRQNIRDTFKELGVHSTLDKRFKTHTAHMTCLRFQDSLMTNAEFLSYLQQNKDTDFGTSEIFDLEFVVNDWYMSEENTKVLRCFQLNWTSPLS